MCITMCRCVPVGWTSSIASFFPTLLNVSLENIFGEKLLINYMHRRFAGIVLALPALAVLSVEIKELAFTLKVRNERRKKSSKKRQATGQKNTHLNELLVRLGGDLQELRCLRQNGSKGNREKSNLENGKKLINNYGCLLSAFVVDVAFWVSARGTHEKYTEFRWRFFMPARDHNFFFSCVFNKLRFYAFSGRVAELLK